MCLIETDTNRFDEDTCLIAESESLLMKNKELRASFYDRPCSVCGSVPSDPAHIRTYGASGIDEEDGILLLCRRHHQMQGQYGWKKMCELHSNLIDVLDYKGWKIMNNGKLVRK